MLLLMGAGIEPSDIAKDHLAGGSLWTSTRPSLPILKQNTFFVSIEREQFHRQIRQPAVEAHGA
jgi:hypothetical protein